MHLCLFPTMPNPVTTCSSLRIQKVKCFSLRRFLLLLLLLSGWAGYGQRYNFTNYTIANGLKSNQINEIIQDRNGRLWIGTMNGASSYDGITFTHPDPSSSIATNPVKSIFEDRYGNIWFGTIRKGLVRYSGNTYKNFTMNNGLLSDIVNAIVDDADSTIWIGTSEGLSRYQHRKFTNYTTSQGLVGNTVFALHMARDGRLWIATSGGLSIFDGKTFTNYTVADGLVSNVIFCIHEATDGKVWLGTYQGISVMDQGKITNYSIEQGLSNIRIEDITEDRSGNIWVATNGGGIAKINNNRITPVSVGEGVNSNIVKSIIEDREGNYWLGTWYGIFKYNGDRFVSFTIDDGLSSNNVLSIYADANNRIWMGTLTGGINIYSENRFRQVNMSDGLRSSTIWSIYHDNNGDFWFGTTNGAYKYNDSLNTLELPFPQLQSQIIYAIEKDKMNNLWFGTDRGIYRYSNSGFLVIDSRNGLEEEKVRVLHCDSAGIMWIGTLKGVYYYQTDSLYSLNRQQNLPDAPVTSIISNGNDRLISTYDFGVFVCTLAGDNKRINVLNKTTGLNNERVNFNFIDSHGNLWLGTPQGLDRIDWNIYKSEKRVDLIHYDKGNGYLGVESNAACEDTSGYIWFGTANGAIRFSPDAAVVRATLPSVFISKIQLFYEDVDWRKNKIRINRITGLPENLILAYNNNHLSFIYSGIYLTAPDEVQYRFMLEGFDEGWSPVTKLNFANYSNLPAGDYIFKVQASANQRDWSVPVTYSFTIKRPYWKTPFFYLLYIAAAVGSVWLGYNYRTRSLRRRSEMLKQTVNARTRELQEKNLELAKLSLVASETDNAVMIFNHNLDLEWVNTGFTKLTGYTLGEIRNVRGSQLRDLTSNPLVIDHLDECIAEKRSFIYESELMNKDGRQIWTSSTLTPILDNGGKLTNVVVIDTDITLRKQMEEQIRASLEERGVLLREIHHRVKNNLQIIISLFNLQTHYVQDPGASKALREGQNRIKSMALIHERFYQSDGLSRIDFDDYIRRLTDNLLQTSGITSGKVDLNIITEKISLDIDTAVPCGLIINEVVSNSLKHAFNDGRKGEILIQFSRTGESAYRLVIADNGTGLPQGFDLEKSDSLGIQLIHALAGQIDGTLKIENSNGVKYIIDFKTIHK
jgi:PAS domain S-box-containing protein